MENIMITKKINQFKKASYFCLTLLSAALPLTAQAMDSLVRENRERAISHRNLVAPKQSENLFDKLKLLFQSDDTYEEESEEDDPSQGHSDLIKRDEKSSKINGLLDYATQLREAMEQENEDLQKVQETAIKGLGYYGEAIIDDKVKNPEAKSFFLNLLGKGQKRLSNFLSQK